MPPKEPQQLVQSVTSVPSAAADDADQRIKRYLVTMTIRTLCFILMILVTGWMRWVFLAGAAILPYVAVVLVNARAPRVQGQVAPVLPHVDDQKHVGG